MSGRLEHNDKRIDEWLGLLLRAGVILAASVVLAGGVVVFLARNSTLPINYRVFQGEPQGFRTISGIIGEARAFRGRGLVQLGLLILIATPIARVAFSVFAFLFERDWKYTGFTLAVLALLLYSLLGGRS
jgi:uncharacterized membrane protein